MMTTIMTAFLTARKMMTATALKTTRITTMMEMALRTSMTNLSSCEESKLCLEINCYCFFEVLYFYKLRVLFKIEYLEKWRRPIMRRLGGEGRYRLRLDKGIGRWQASLQTSTDKLIPAPKTSFERLFYLKQNPPLLISLSVDHSI